MHGLTSDRQRKLGRRHKTYLRHAAQYNLTHGPETLIQTPSFDLVKRMNISDPFWEMAGLSHPDEDWATDPRTRAGIESWRTQRSSREEMQRIAREVRQQLQWAIDYSANLRELGHMSE